MSSIRRFGSCLMVSAFAGVTAGPTAAQEFFRTERDVSGEEWAADIRTLAAELEVRHAAPYPGIEPARFRAAADSLADRVGGLTDDEVVLAIARLTARIGEGHTGVLPFDRGYDERRLPVEFYQADDGSYFVLAAAPEHAGLLGATLERIDGTPIEVVAAAMEPLMPRDNRYTLRKLGVDYLRIPGLLAALKFVRSPDSVPIQVRHPDGRRQAAVLRPRPRHEAVDWRFAPAGQRQLWLRNRETQYWFALVPEHDAAYVQFNSADIGAGADELAFAAFTDSLVAAIEDGAVDRLIIDMRWNTGGSFPRSRHLLHAAIRADRVNRPGRLFVIIGNTTYSAANSLALEFDTHTHALFVGEPTGGSAQSYGDLRRLRLPHSGLVVRYAAHRSTAAGATDRRPAVFPDLRAGLSVAEYRQGVDPALEAIWAYAPRRPVADTIRVVLENRGIDAALAEYRTLRCTAFNRFQFDIQQLNRLGYELLRAGRHDDALRIFLVNVELHPWVGYIYDSVADAYFALDDSASAMDWLRQAFERDRSLPRWRDLLLEDN